MTLISVTKYEVFILFAIICIYGCYGCDWKYCVLDQTYYFCLRKNDINHSLQIPNPWADKKRETADWDLMKVSDNKCLVFDLIDVIIGYGFVEYTSRFTLYDTLGLQLHNITVADSGVYRAENVINGNSSCKLYDVHVIEFEAFQSGKLEMLSNDLGNSTKIADMTNGTEPPDMSNSTKTTDITNSTKIADFAGNTELSCGLPGQSGPLALIEWQTEDGSKRKTSRKDGNKWIYVVPKGEENIQIECKVNMTFLKEICPRVEFETTVAKRLTTSIIASESETSAVNPTKKLTTSKAREFETNTANPAKQLTTSKAREFETNTANQPSDSVKEEETSNMLIYSIAFIGAAIVVLAPICYLLHKYRDLHRPAVKENDSKMAEIKQDTSVYNTTETSVTSPSSVTSSGTSSAESMETSTTSSDQLNLNINQCSVFYIK